MAQVTISKLRGTQQPTVHREASRVRQVARKAGIVIPKPMLSLPETEQEETDIA